MGKIFINYRREDSRGEARALFDRLSARFPDQVFMDVNALDPGVDFVQAIDNEVGSCDACVVVIGKNWVSSANSNGQRRLDDPQDFVRLEIATALKRNVTVVPALVGGASMPAAADLPGDLQSLTRRNALFLTDQGWDDDVNRLIRALERAVPGIQKQSSVRRPGRWLIMAGAIVVVGILSTVGLRFLWPKGPVPSESISPPPGFTHSLRAGDFIFDYQSSTGGAEIRRVGWFNKPSFVRSIDNFSPGWTSVLGIPSDIFFYNRNTGAAALLRLSQSGEFKPVNPGFSLAAGWTSILHTPNGVFFYNKSDGSAEIVRFDTAGHYKVIRSHEPGYFGLGWTVVRTAKGLEFHDPDGSRSTIVGDVDGNGDFSPIT